MSKVLRWVAVAFAILLVAPVRAGAHPLGNFTVNRFAGLEIAPTEIVVSYAVDIAEVPTFQELASIDTDRNGATSPAERASYATRKAAFVLEGLVLTIDGAPAHLAVTGSEAQLQKGQAGLQVLRLDVRFIAPLPRATAVIAFEDLNFDSFPGWGEVVASGVRGEAIVKSDVPNQSISNGLRAYPRSLLQRPPNVRRARVKVAPGTGAPSAAPSPVDEDRVATTRLFGERFASLIERDLSPVSFMVALLLAAAFGALHALGPGHGKTVMAVYLVGAEGRVRHAVTVGLAVSVMHTVSVIALGLVTLSLANLWSPAAVYPWLALVSGAIIVVLGAWMFSVRWRARARALDHPHDAEHTHAQPPATPFSRKGLAAIALSGGLVPSPTAVVVLLGALALHRIAFGIILIVAFSFGLAASLSAVGIAVVRARTFAAARWELDAASLLPSLSSAAIFLIGVLLTARAALTLT